MTRLERRCRLLLRAYPAAYRRDRGDEMIGTLLDATPEGRNWPLLSDIRALAIAGLRARCTMNRERTTTANMRIAVVVGAAAYLCLDTSQWLHSRGGPSRGFSGLPLTLSQFAGPAWLGPALTAAAVTLACTCRWRAVILTAAIPAAVLVWLAPSGFPFELGAPGVVLPCLAVLVILGGSPERPGGAWLWPVVAAAAAPWLIGPHVGSDATLEIIAAVAVISIGWIVVDAKLAIAGAVFLMAVWLSTAMTTPGAFIIWGPYFYSVPTLLLTLIIVGFVAAAAATAVWRLRRQSARPDRRTG